MLFNSIEYLLFFLAVLVVSWSLVRWPTVRMLFVLLASYYFYASNNYFLVLLIVFGPAVDYFAGLMIAKSTNPVKRKLFLTLSLATNLLVLGYFKYVNFFISSVAAWTNHLGIHLSWVDLHIALPAGISFYTFQSMSYAIDVYRGQIPAERSFLRWNFYVTFFPHLIAGPIVRASTFLPQAGKRPRLTTADVESALYDIATGIFKKMVLADTLAIFVSRGFDHSGQTDIISTWLAVYAFAFQIYFDFSGYTDIAIGCSRLMGYQLPINFCRPYMAYSASDFWKRWHISLSSWLRDYLYIPLGGNRSKSKLLNYRNLMLTMLLGGLWHGAAWHFMLWGFMHGCVLIIEKIFGVVRTVAMPKLFSFGIVLRRFIFFNFIVLTWLVFRCANLHELSLMLHKLFTFHHQPLIITKGTLVMSSVIIAGYLAQWIGEYVDIKQQFLRMPIAAKSFAYATTCILIMMVASEVPKPFIYFQF
jgi:alginate O-acetyltransferase complex protein AlgI